MRVPWGPMQPDELIAIATRYVGEFQPGPQLSAGSVAAAILSESGRVYTGICVDTQSSLGFCAEHAAVAEMLKARESVVRLVVAVRAGGSVLPPCGRCRELLWQLSEKNATAGVVLARGRVVPLAQLLPEPSYGHPAV